MSRMFEAKPPLPTVFLRSIRAGRCIVVPWRGTSGKGWAIVEPIFADLAVVSIEGSCCVRDTNQSWTEPVSALNPATIALHPLF